MNWRAVKAFLVRDVKSTFRDKAALFWIIAWPIIWILMTAYVFVPPGTGSVITLSVGVVNDDHSTAPFNGTYLVELMNKTMINGKHLFKVEMINDPDRLKELLLKGRLDAGIIIPDGFGENATYGTGRLTVFVRADNPSTKQIYGGIITGFIQGVSHRLSSIKINISLTYISKYMPTNSSVSLDRIKQYLIGIAFPINASLEEIVPESVGSRPAIIGWYTLGAIGMMFLYTGLMIGAAMIVREKELGTLKRLLASPSSGPELLLGKTLGGIIILTVSALIALLVGIGVAGARIYWDPLNPVDWLVPVLILAAAVMAIGMGLILSLASRTSKGASSLSTALGLLFTFTAGIWFPKEWLPGWMRVFAENFPFTWTIDGIRDIIVYQYSLQDILPLFVKSLAAALIIFSAGALIYRFQIRRYAEK